MNHNNVISLEPAEAILKGQIVEVDTNGKAKKATIGSNKDAAIGVVLHDVDPAEIKDAAAIHLFDGIVVAEAQGEISVGDIVGTRDDSPYLVNDGALRQVGISLESVPAGQVYLIRVVTT
jgi:hypothetical protein